MFRASPTLQFYILACEIRCTKRSRSGHPSSRSYVNIANLYNYTTTTLYYIIVMVNMSTSSAAHTLLNALDPSDTSVAANTVSQDAPANDADSELISTYSSNHTTLRKSRNSRRIHWQEEVEEQVPRIPRRSTRGVAPQRLGELLEAELSTPLWVSEKRKPATQPPQPPLKKVSAGRKPLSDAANTLGKTRALNIGKVVAKQSPARPKPPTKPSAPKSRVQHSPPIRSTTTQPITSKSKDKR